MNLFFCLLVGFVAADHFASVVGDEGCEGVDPAAAVGGVPGVAETDGGLEEEVAVVLGVFGDESEGVVVDDDAVVVWNGLLFVFLFEEFEGEGELRFVGVALDDASAFFECLHSVAFGGVHDGGALNGCRECDPVGFGWIKDAADILFYLDGGFAPVEV